MVIGAGRAGARLTIANLAVVTLFVAIATMVTSTGQPADTDTWWHLKTGQLIWQQGRIPLSDPFSHTVAGAPWIDHGWLVQAILWPFYQAFGLGGLALLLAAAITLTFAIVYKQCAGRPYLAALAVLLAAISSSVVWAIRPQIASLLLTAAVTFLLYRYRESGQARWLWPIPLLVVMWVNCHGGFVIAFILLGCHLVGEVLNRLLHSDPERPLPAAQPRLRPLLLTLLACLPATLLNPNTYKMLPYAFQTVSIGPLQDFIQEWAAPDFHSVQLQPFVWLLLLTLGALGLSRRRANWIDLAMLLIFAYMALLAVRNVALFALIAPPILTRHAAAAIRDMTRLPRLAWLGTLVSAGAPARPRRGLPLLNLLLLALILTAAGAGIGLVLVHLDDPATWGRGLPLDAAAYMASEEIPGKMYNTYNWGGYLIWSLYPAAPVFVDGRTDLYALNGHVLDDYVQIHLARPGWQELLASYDIGHAVTEREGMLALALAEAEAWTLVYQDDLAVIYEQEGPGQ